MKVDVGKARKLMRKFHPGALVETDGVFQMILWSKVGFDADLGAHAHEVCRMEPNDLGLIVAIVSTPYSTEDGSRFVEAFVVLPHGAGWVDAMMLKVVRR